MRAGEPSQGSKMVLSYSPLRSPASLRFYGLSSQKQQRSSPASKKPPEPLRRAVADCLSSTALNVHGNPTPLSSEASKILRDYLANPTTVDMAYNVLIDHALAERDRSPAVVPRCIALLKRFLLRYVPKEQILRQIDAFCENTITECNSITNQRVSLWSKSLSQHSGASSNFSASPLPASSFASASLVKSLNYVRSLVAQHFPKLSFETLGKSGMSTSGKQSLPSLSSLFAESTTSHLISEVVTNTDVPQRKENTAQTLLTVSNLDRLDTGTNCLYICSDLLNWRLSGDRDLRSPYLMRESEWVLKCKDLHRHGLIEVGAAALLIDNKEAKANEKSWKHPAARELPDVNQLLQPSSTTTAANFGLVDNHLKAIASSKRRKGGPNQVWDNIPTTIFHPRASPLFQYRHYSEQLPLRLNPAEISEVIAEACSEGSSMNLNSTMTSPLAKHNARSAAEIAVSVLIKLVLDMYVMDSESAAPLTLSMLEDMLSSQTVASRVRVFDLILNLGVHAHLLEPVLYDETSAFIEEVASNGSFLDNEGPEIEENGNHDASLQRRMDSSIINFERWLLHILCEVLHLLVQTEEREEIVWASALSCLFYFICDRSKLLRSRLDYLDIRVVKSLLKICREHSWEDIVHCKLICILTNMLYDTHNGYPEVSFDTPRFLIEQVNLLGGIDFICLEYSQAKSSEEKRNLFLVLFDYALYQINEELLASGASVYSFDEVQPVLSILTLADAPEVFYISVKHGVEGIDQFLSKSISGALARSPNYAHLNQLFEMILKKLDVCISAFTLVDNEFAHMIQLTKGYRSSSDLDELGEDENGARIRYAWATLHSLLHSERAACRHHGYIWLVKLLLLEIKEDKSGSIWLNAKKFKQQIAVTRSQDLVSSAVQLPIRLMCGLLKSKHNFIRRGFLFVLERFLVHCKIMLDEAEQQRSSQDHNDMIEDRKENQLHKANVIIDIMSSALSLVVHETDHHNILKMCDILFSQLCLRLPTTNGTSSKHSKLTEQPNSLSNENCKSDLPYISHYPSKAGNFPNENESIAVLVLRGHAIAPVQLIARVPASLFYWPLIQLAGAATDDIALGVAVGSEGRANLPGSTSDIRAALLLLLIGKCSADSAAFLEVEGEEFFRGLLDDTDPRVAYCSAAFLLKRMMTEEPENYQRTLQYLLVKAQQCNNEMLLENPYLQMRGILQLANDPAG